MPLLERVESSYILSTGRVRVRPRDTPGPARRVCVRTARTRLVRTVTRRAVQNARAHFRAEPTRACDAQNTRAPRAVRSVQDGSGHARTGSVQVKIHRRVKKNHGARAVQAASARTSLVLACARVRVFVCPRWPEQLPDEPLDAGGARPAAGVVPAVPDPAAGANAAIAAAVVHQIALAAAIGLPSIGSSSSAAPAPAPSSPSATAPRCRFRRSSSARAAASSARSRLREPMARARSPTRVLESDWLQLQRDVEETDRTQRTHD